MRTLCLAVVATGLLGCGEVLEESPGVPDAGPSDAPSDGGVDAAVDAAPSLTDYDIAYINEFTFSNSVVSIGSFIVVVNRGPVPLDLSTTSVTAFSDDNAAVGWRFSKLGMSSTQLMPGSAAGELSPLATTEIISKGKVPEPLVQGTGFNFGMEFQNVPAGIQFNLNGQATISIDGESITLPFTIHFVPGASTAFNNASRINTPL